MFRYLLPALIPSWRFFDYIRPAPRIEFALSASGDDMPAQWREFRPRPDRLSMTIMLRRLFWNPRWNETLFMVTCAEKLLDEPSPWHEDALLTRIAAAVTRGETGDAVIEAIYLRFRIVVLTRESGQIDERVGLVSSARRIRIGAL